MYQQNLMTIIWTFCECFDDMKLFSDYLIFSYLLLMLVGSYVNNFGGMMIEVHILLKNDVFSPHHS